MWPVSYFPVDLSRAAVEDRSTSSPWFLDVHSYTVVSPANISTNDWIMILGRSLIKRSKAGRVDKRYGLNINKSAALKDNIQELFRRKDKNTCWRYLFCLKGAAFFMDIFWTFLGETRINIQILTFVSFESSYFSEYRKIMRFRSLLKAIPQGIRKLLFRKRSLTRNKNERSNTV